MDAIKYMEIFERMCSVRECKDCEFAPDGCHATMRENPEEAVKIVERWENQHQAITNLEKFVEVFGIRPNASACIIMECHTKGCRACDFFNWWGEPYLAPKGEEE